MSTAQSILGSAGLPAKQAERATAAKSNAVEAIKRWSIHVARLAELSDEELAKHDIASLNLHCARLLPGAEGIDDTACLRKLDEWARLVRLNTEHWMKSFATEAEKCNHSRNRFRMMALVTVLQKNLGVKYYQPFSEGEYNATDSRNLFIHGPLNGHGGTCVTMPVLYIAVGRRLGYPLKLVRAHQHFFARWDDPGGERFNIECTCYGFHACDDNHYLTRPKPIPPALLDKGVYLKSLKPREEMAAFLIERASCWADNLCFSGAEAAYHYASLFTSDRFFFDCGWLIANILRTAIEDAERRARMEGRRSINLSTIPLPDKEAWQRGMAPVAQECFDRILRIHAEKSAAAKRGFFEKFASENGGAMTIRKQS
jgi:hypothetical protein